MSKRRKFYKYTIVPVFSFILSFVLIGKSAQAAGSITVGVGSANIQATGFNVGPDNIDTADQTTQPATSNAAYHFSAQSDVRMNFDMNAGVSSEYRGGYISGIVVADISYLIAFSPSISPGTYFDISFNGVSNDTIQTAIGSVSKTGKTVKVMVYITLNNYSLPVVNSGNRELRVGSIGIDFTMYASADGSLRTASCQSPVVGITTSTINISATANAGQSIAGQIYAAIENSTSIDDIIAYLSMIEDSNGDINVAVAHINQTLIPNVITNLQSLIANTNLTNTKLNTLISYLYAISSTWPDYSAQVLFYLSQLVNMNEEQSSMAAEVESQYEAKASEGAQLNQGMQVVIPSVDQNSFDINAGIDTGTITTLTAFWSMFTHNSLISIMFTIAIAGIAAGFFLYGKKG